MIRGVLSSAGLCGALLVVACSGGGKGGGDTGSDSTSSGGTSGNGGEGADGAGGSGGSGGSNSSGQGGTDTGGSGGGGGDGSDTGGSGGDSGGNGGSGATAGSGGGGNGGVGGCPLCEPTITLEEFCDGFADSVCDHLQRCLGFADRAACEAWPRWPSILLTCSAGVEAVEAGRLSFDGWVGAACLAAHEDPECPLSVPVVRAGLGVGPCIDVFVGEVEEGGDCYPASTATADECAPGNYCVGQCPGECVALTALGDDCQSDVECGVGAYCDEVCLELPGQGEDCEGRCLWGLSCLPITGTCELSRQPGDDCLEGADCSTGFCIDDACAELPGDGEECFEYDQCAGGHVCWDGTCYESVETGEPCGYDSNCPDGERCLNGQTYGRECRLPGEAGDFCQVNDDCAPGLICNWDILECAEPGEQDEPCTALIADTCAEDLFCDRVTETCIQPVGEDEACNPTAGRMPCVEGFYCECSDAPGCPGISSEPNDTDICVAQKDDGEACSRNVECASGACLNTLEGPLCGDPDDVRLLACAGP